MRHWHTTQIMHRMFFFWHHVPCIMQYESWILPSRMHHKSCTQHFSCYAYMQLWSCTLPQTSYTSDLRPVWISLEWYVLHLVILYLTSHGVSLTLHIWHLTCSRISHLVLADSPMAAFHISRFAYLVSHIAHNAAGTCTTHEFWAIYVRSWYIADRVPRKHWAFLVMYICLTYHIAPMISPTAHPTSLIMHPAPHITHRTVQRAASIHYQVGKISRLTLYHASNGNHILQKKNRNQHK